MAALRIVPAWRKNTLGMNVISQLKRPKYNSVYGLIARRLLSSLHITKNIEIISQADQITKNGFEIINGNKQRPLLILLCWLLAKKKHYMKIAEFYMQQGFDVVAVTLTPWQLIWPKTGSQMVAADLLKFLHINEDRYNKILVHGFSIGGYFWGEVLSHMHRDLEGNDRLMKNIVGHIWDSAADITEFPHGTPKALLPNNPRMQNLMQQYLEFHLKTFYNQVTQHYVRSSQLFHTNIIRSPTLFIISRNDTVGSLSSNLSVKNDLDSLGVQTYMKVFEESPHVGHFAKYPKEYIEELCEFLSKLELIQNKEKVNEFISKRMSKNN